MCIVLGPLAGPELDIECMDLSADVGELLRAGAVEIAYDVDELLEKPSSVSEKWFEVGIFAW